MTFYRRFIFVLSAFALVAISCTKPVLIGSDFLEDEKLFLNFEDEFDLQFFTEPSDSIIVHSGTNIGLQLITYLLGDINDPIFGHYTAEIFAQPMLPTVAHELIGATLDSVIVHLRYDTLGNYGDLNQTVTIEVNRMIEKPVFAKNIYSSESFLIEPVILGSVTLVPKPFDSVTVYTPSDTVRVAPHIRIPLTTFRFDDLLLQDSSVFTNQDTFLSYFNGLNFKMTGAGNTMIGIDLLDPVSGLTIYYHKGESDGHFTYIFTSGSVKTVHMEHDYTGSPASAALAPEEENDYWYVQGLAGLTTHMKIADISKLGNAIINQAELEVYCTFPDGDVPHLYPPIPYLVTQEKNDSTYVNSLDVAVALVRTNGNQTSPGFATYFGGGLEKVVSGPPAVYRYNMKVTSQVKDIFLGKKENIIYFNPFDKGNAANRSVMFGPGHPEYAPRLRIYYTAL